MSKKLTIAIPTFNRKSELKHQLDRLSLILSKMENDESKEVEILVSDNASNYDIISLINLYQNRFPNNCFVFMQNKTNMGFDANIAKLYQSASGKYVWFLSDDDNFRCDTVKILLNLINTQNTLSLIILNQYDYPRKNGDLVDLIPYSPCGEKLSVTVGKEKTIENEKDRLFAILLSGQISHCVVKKMDLEFDVSIAGGMMQEQLANLALLKEPNFFMTEEGLILPGPKTDLSYWFLDACIFGARTLFSAPIMQFSKELYDIVSVQTAKLGLDAIINSRKYCRKVYYDDLEQVEEKLKQNFADSYGELEAFINDSRQKASIIRDKSILGCCILSLLRKIKNYIFRKNKDCLHYE